MGVESGRRRLVSVILTKDESRHIVACVESLRARSDVVVVWDSLSDDGTQALARQAGAVVIERPFDNYAAQRQAVLDSVDAEWILFVDADERATPALMDEVEQVLDGVCDGYWIPRQNYIVGHLMQGGGFYPDHQLRLLRRSHARYVPEREVHEIVEVQGEEGYLEAPLIHYNYDSWDLFYRKQRAYAAYEARILAARGIRPRPHNFILQPLREFKRRFIDLRGYRDGLHGLRIALLLAWFYGFVPYWLLAGGNES